MGMGLVMTVFSLVILTACKDSNSNCIAAEDKIAQTKARAESTDWAISYFFNKDTDQTSKFSGYAFTFNWDGTLTAVKTTTAAPRRWSVSYDDSDEDNGSDDVDFNISFASPDFFTDLSRGWHIVYISDTKAELTHVSGGNGGTTSLTSKSRNISRYSINL